jgi:hypothetical protein
MNAVLFNTVFWLIPTLSTPVASTTYLSASDRLVLEDEVDLVEVNHYHDARGQHVFDQLIFYDWSSQQRRFQVRAWRLVKSERQLPRRDYRNGGWLVRWHDDGMLREVSAGSYRETWTQHDPELIQREYLPQEQRLDLSSPRPPSQRRPAALYRIAHEAQ